MMRGVTVNYRNPSLVDQLMREAPLLVRNFVALIRTPVNGSDHHVAGFGYAPQEAANERRAIC